MKRFWLKRDHSFLLVVCAMGWASLTSLHQWPWYLTGPTFIVGWVVIGFVEELYALRARRRFRSGLAGAVMRA